MLVTTIMELVVPVVSYILLQFSAGIPSLFARALRELFGWLADFVTRSPFSGELRYARASSYCFGVVLS